MRVHHLIVGSTLSVVGVGVMAFIAWSTREDKHYDDFGSAVITLAALLAGGVFVLGLGPLASWLLGVLGRRAVRLPPPVRLAVHDVAGNRVRTATMITIMMSATTLAVAVAIIAIAVTAQNRAGYFPQGRSDALVVRDFSTEDVAAVRAAVQRELPGVPIAQIDRQLGEGHFRVDIENVDLPDLESVAPPGLIGDQGVLRYLTGDPAMPYDENTAVVVTVADVEVDRVTIDYDLSGIDGPLSTKTIPAIVVRPADPRLEELFLPAKVIRDLGYQLEPEKLIVDPSLHRTTAAEQERLERRVGENAIVYVERGFQASSDWQIFVAAALLATLGAALAASGTGATGSRQERVLLRISGGSAVPPRLFVACRAGLSAACGTAMGVAAGCVVGLLLVWPITTSIEWEPMPRVAFETPWLSMAALVVGLPVLAAAVAALFPPGKTARRDRPAGAPG
ncbi:hypothetical protein [Streptosporangium sp. NPDC051022]|uniref:hypothetical protein n=1 Tax=Streptosporangium sp. NPDC051022 TaxID=3155752 RepID=UPI00342516DA